MACACDNHVTALLCEQRGKEPFDCNLDGCYDECVSPDSNNGLCINEIIYCEDGRIVTAAEGCIDPCQVTDCPGPL